MNKNFYSFGIAALMLLFSGNAMATDYYLSANGNDANDGKTAATALKTLSALMPKVKQWTEGEHVYVSGIIKVDAGWTKAHLNGIVFEGTNPETDGFDAEGNTYIFHLNNTIATFKNLSFKNGNMPVVSNSQEQGAAAIYGGPLKLTLDNCIFENNKNVENANANTQGGAIFITGTNPAYDTNNPNKYPDHLGIGGIFATNCKFIGNTAEAGGAAISANGNIVVLKNCYFQDNVATNHGGAFFGNAISSLNLDGSAFVGNETKNSQGGAIYIYMHQTTDKVYTISNSTFYQNRAKGEGGAFSASDNKNSSFNTINFVHCTMTGNSTAGTVEGAGGIAINGKPGTVNIVNSILQGNLALGNADSFADVTFRGTSVKFVNSYVGAIRKFDDYKEESYTFDDKSVLNNLTASNSSTDLGDYVEALHIVPLKAESAAKTAADLSADAAYGVTADQLGTAWTKAYIGAVQLDVNEAATGIATVKVNAPKTSKGIYNIAGQYVGNDASQLVKGIYIVDGKKMVVK